MIRLDADEGVLMDLAEGFDKREPVTADLTDVHFGYGRELFSAFRHAVSRAEDGATVFGGRDLGNG